MIITREKLIRLAEREIERQARKNDILSGYVIGSVARGKPLLGGAADVDLVLIHKSPPILKRQIVTVSEQVHLDITHNERELYESPKDLRIDPWLGPSMCEPLFLYDPEHFFEWSQAGVRGQFHRPDHVHARARAFLRLARETKHQLGDSSSWIGTLAKGALEGANAAGCLRGFPVAGRRLTLKLEKRASDLGRPEVYTGFLDLFGGSRVDKLHFPDWVAALARAYDAAIDVSADAEMVASRRAYYLQGFQALAEAGRPEAALWTMLTLWNRVIESLVRAGAQVEFLPAWMDCLHSLRLSDDQRAAREAELEEYLDSIELTLAAWSERQGL